MNFKAILGASAAALALTGSAIAADLPGRAAPPVIVAPAPIFTWTGAYIGLTAGYGWGKTEWAGYPTGAWAASPPADVAAIAALQSGSANKGSFTGGLQVGYNYQFGPVIVGAEADFNYLDTKVYRAAGALLPVAGTFVTTSTWAGIGEFVGTVRGKLGFGWDRFMVYGTGGLAYGNTTITQNVFFAATGSSAIGSYSAWKAGWTAGAGVEWAFTPNWSAKVEYLHIDLGSRTSTGLINAAFPTFFHVAETRRMRADLVRAGVNYRFGWGGPAAVVARY